MVRFELTRLSSLVSKTNVSAISPHRYLLKLTLIKIGCFYTTQFIYRYVNTPTLTGNTELLQGMSRVVNLYIHYNYSLHLIIL